MKYILWIIIPLSFYSINGLAYKNGNIVKLLKASDELLICNINCDTISCGESFFCDSLAIVGSKYTRTVKRLQPVTKKDFFKIRALFENDTTYMSQYRKGRILYSSSTPNLAYTPNVGLILKKSGSVIAQFVIDINTGIINVYQNEVKKKVIFFDWHDILLGIFQSYKLECLEH